jgi:UDP-N-acetylmuramate--alanine ligase
VTTYGVNEGAEVRAVNIEFAEAQTRFDVVRESRSGSVENSDGNTADAMSPVLHVSLKLPGMHNVQNALAAIAVADELQIGDEAVKRALDSFEGIDRRFQTLGELTTKAGNVTLVDDYGHHPTEIEATLAAARSGWPGRRVVLAFQPHRYTRTRDLMDDFASVLSGADVLVLLEVYAAGEEPIAGADGRAMARAIRTRGVTEPVFVETLEELPAVLGDLLQDGDLLLTMGAGDIGAYASELANELGDGPALQVHS